MIEAIRFPYLDAMPSHPEASLMPFLPLTLAHGGRQVAASGLLDTGAAANVLPFSVGESLGLIWEAQRVPIVLSGNLAHIPARGIVVSATVDSFAPVRLAFAWAQIDNIRLLLGQANFFHEFDACFFRARSEFEIRPKTQRQ